MTVKEGKVSVKFSFVYKSSVSIDSCSYKRSTDFIRSG